VDHDRLFLETLRDLNYKVRGDASAYELLRASALMRQLLLDSSPLVHKVNRRRQHRITYRWLEVDAESIPRSGVPMPKGLVIGLRRRLR
jgi:hypothetical protein